MSTAASPLKLHLRLVTVGEYEYRIVTLRPSCGVRFSSNCFHGTWHIVTDPPGSTILARLLWGLAFQRKPGTLVLIDEPHLVPTPFEGDRPLPCVFAASGSARLDHGLLAGLKKKLARPGKPDATVKWHTFGMARAAEDEGFVHGKAWRSLWKQERMEERAGLVCYSAPPRILQCQALQIMQLDCRVYRGMDYLPIAQGRGESDRTDGEVQILVDFASRVSAARLARARILANPRQSTTHEDERPAIWKEAQAILGYRARKRRRRMRAQAREGALTRRTPSRSS